MAEVTPGAVAPEVPVVPAADAAPAPDATAAPVVETPEGEKPAERTFTQKEMDEVVQKRLAKESRRFERIARAEAERDFLKRQLEDAQRPREQPQSQGKPQAKDFQDYDSYMEALTDWKVDQKLSQQREQSANETEKQREERDFTERARDVQEKVVTKGREKYADFDDVALAEDLPITPAMAEAIRRLPTGAEVWYHLGQNPKEASRIARLPVVEQVWEVKNLESKLSAPPATTKAPAPIVPGGTKTTVDKDWSELSDKEFAEKRRRQIAQRR